MTEGKLELYISCRHLVNTDMGSLSDAFVILSRKTQTGWMTVGRSEIIWNSLNPDFSKSFQVDFQFERRQIFKIECRDADNDSGSQYDSLGEAQFELGTVVGSRNCTLLLNLTEGSKLMGKTVIRAEPIGGNNEAFTFKFEGHNLGKSYFCFQEKPFFTISKKITRHGHGNNEERQNLINAGETDEWLKVYESELGRGSHVYFNHFTVQSVKFCSNDLDTPIRVVSIYISSVFMDLSCATTICTEVRSSLRSGSCLEAKKSLIFMIQIMVVLWGASRLFKSRRI